MQDRWAGGRTRTRAARGVIVALVMGLVALVYVAATHVTQGVASIYPPPSAPSITSLTVSGNNITVGIGAPAINASSVTAYQVEVSTDGSSWTVVTNSVSSAATSYTIADLVPNTSYYVRVAARYASGLGAYGYRWQKIYDVVSPTRSGNAIQYASGFGIGASDARATYASTAFTRVRYRMAATYDGANNYVDADFSKTLGTKASYSESFDSLLRLQVPTTDGNGFEIHANVSDLTVASNVSGVANGYGMSGRLEIWPWNYGFAAATGFSARSVDLYDDSDTPAFSSRYGSFQLHRLSATASERQTIFAWNRHAQLDGPPDIGFGNAPAGYHSDWTFVQNTLGVRSNFNLQIFIDVPITTSISAPSTPVLAASSDTGTSASDRITSDSTPTITVSGMSAGATGTVTATRSSTTVTCALSSGSCTLGTLSDGVWSITATQTQNGVTSSASSALSITIDTTRPTVSSISASPTTVSAGSSSTLTFITSESTTDFALTDLSATLGTVSGFSGSGTTYTATFTAASSVDGTAVVTVASGSFSDTAGNTNATTGTRSITVTNTSTASGGRTSFTGNGTIGVNSTKYVVERFTSTGTSSWTVPQGVTSVDYLVVGGGGGGGAHVGGGGGGGGVRTGSMSGLTPGSSLSVVVGAGGAGSVISSTNAHVCTDAARSKNGAASSLGAVSAAGGGGGGAWDYCAGNAGGSGGGGGTTNNRGLGNSPSTSPAQGSNGGNGSGATNVGGFNYTGGGGGGAAQVGGTASANTGGTGGNGVSSTITGAELYFGGGGGGGVHGPGGTAGSGGLGGGGAGNVATSTAAASGQANTGGGGGGAGQPSNLSSQGGSGGSGIVVVRYALPGVSAPDLADASDDGSSSTDNLTSLTTLTFTGSAPVGSVVQLQAALADASGTATGSYVNTGSTCTANSSTGEWSCATGTLSAGRYVVQAVSTTYLDGGTEQQTSSALPIAIAGAATKLSVVTQPVGAGAGAALATQPVVRLLDANDLLVEAGSVSVSASASSGTLGGTRSVASSNGIATFTDLTFAGTASTDYTLSFAAASLSGETSNNFRVTVGTATQLVLTTSASGAAYDTAFTTQPVVEVRDAGGNKVTSPTFVVTATLSAGTVVGTGNTTLTASTSSGTATFAGLGITGSPGSYTVTYSSGSLTTASQSVSVVKASQSALTVTTTSVTFGQTLSLATSGGSGDGAVTFVVSSGTCSVSGSTLTPGDAGSACEVTATKAADTNYLVVSSAATSISIAKASQSALTVTTTSVTFGQTLSLASSGGSGTGAVTFVVSSGTCSVSGSTLTPGDAGSTCEVTATKAADTNYLVVSSAATSITIAKANQSTALSLGVTTVTYGQTLTLVGSGGDGGGALSYAVDAGSTCAIGGDGVTLTPGDAGSTCAVVVTRATSTNYNAASSAPLSITITRATPTLGALSLPAKTYEDADFSLINPSADVAGAWSYASALTSVATVSGSTVTIVGAGSTVITATYVPSNTTNFSTTSVTATLTVAKATPTFTWSNMSAIYGDADAAITAPTIATTSARGGWSYSSSAAAVAAISGGDVDFGNAGTATVTATFTPTDTANYVSGGTVTMTVTVAKATPTLGVLSLPAKTFEDGAFGVTAPTASFGGSSVAGTWGYVSADPSVATVSGGTVTIEGAGSSVVTATFTPTDTVNLNAASTTATLTVAKATPTFGWSNVAATYGDADVAITAPAVASTLASGTWSYASADGSIVAIAGSSYDFGNAGTAAVTATFTPTDAANYVSGGTVTMTVTVAKATPTLGALSLPAKTFEDAAFGVTDPSASFGGSSIAGAWSYASALTSVATVSGSTVTIVGAGSTVITATFVPSDTTNFSTTSVTATLTVAKATPTFSWANVSATYGDADVAITAPTVASTLASGTWSYVSGDADVVTVAGSLFNFGDAGTATITATFTPSDTANYVSGGTVTMTVSVAKAEQASLTVTSVSGTYGDDLTLTTSGGATAGSLTWSVGGGSASRCAVVAGVLRSASAGTCDVTVSMAGDDNYEPVSSATTTVTFALRPITVTADAQTKVYGEADPTLTYDVTSGSLANGDVLTGSLSRNPGEDVGAYAISLGTLDNANYTIQFLSADVTITAAPIEVTADSQTKVYGEADPSLTYEVTSGALVGGDAFSGALVRAVGDGVGTYAIGQGSLALSSNYTLTFVPADLTVTAAPIEVTADSQTKVYGEADPSLTYEVTSGALVGGDAFSGALVRAVGDGVGTYAIGQGSLALSSNYTLTFVPADLTVTAAPIEVTAVAGQSKVYGDSDPTFTYSITSGALVVGDTLTGALSRASGDGVGTYALTVGTLANPNYEIAFVSNEFTIDPRAITITADDQTKRYGDNDPSLTYRVTTGALVGSDSLSGALARSSGGAVGTYAITQGTVTSANNPNYTVSFVGGTLTINKATQAALTITTTSVTYGVDTVLSATGGSGTGAVSFAVTNAGTAGCSIVGATLSTTGGAGTTCSITATKAADSNHEVKSSSATTFTVGQLAITVSAASQTKQYGEIDPMLTYTITSGVLVNGDVLSGALDRAAGEDVGTYAIGQGTLDNPNYVIMYVPADLTVTHRPITVTADDATKAFGDADPLLSYSITTGSLVGSDALSGAVARNAGENVGNYVIGRGTLDNPNYLITFVDGTFSVTGATQSGFTLVAGSTTVDYRDSTSLSVSGGNGAGVVMYAVTNGTGRCSIDAGANPPMLSGDAAGTCAVTATKAAEGNYLEAVSNTVTITVAKVAQTITFAAPGDRPFDTDSFTVAPTSDSGQTVVVASATASVCEVSGFDVTVVYAGTCTLTASVPESDNYLAATDVSHSFQVTAVVPYAPTLNAVTATTTSLSLTFAAGSNGGDAIVTYEYSLDSGTTWVALPLGSVTSPLNVGGVQAGRTYVVMLRAVNNVNAGASSNSLSVTVPMPPPPPSSETENTTTTIAVTVTPDRTTETRTRRTTVRDAQDAVTTTTTERVTTTTTASGETSREVTSTTAAPTSSTTALATTQQSSRVTAMMQIPALDPAEAMAVVGNQTGTVEVNYVESTWVSVVAPDMNLTLSTSDGDDTLPLLPNGSMLLTAGGRIDVESTGMLPGANAEFWLFSDPTLLGERRATVRGEIRARFTVPAGIALGAHKIKIVSETADGEPLVVALGVTVAAPEVVAMHRAGNVSEAAADMLTKPGVDAVREPIRSDSTVPLVWALVVLALFAAVGRFSAARTTHNIPVLSTLLEDAQWLRTRRPVRITLPLAAALLAMLGAMGVQFAPLPPMMLVVVALLLIGVADPFSGFVAMVTSLVLTLAFGGVASLDELRYVVIVGTAWWAPGLASSALVRSGVVGGRIAAIVVRATVAVVMFVAVVRAAAIHLDVVTWLDSSVTLLAVLVAVAALVRGVVDAGDESPESEPASPQFGAAPLGIAVLAAIVLSPRTVTPWSLASLALLGVVVAIRVRHETHRDSSRAFAGLVASAVAVAIAVGVVDMVGEVRRIDNVIARHESLLQVDPGDDVGSTPVTVGSTQDAFALRAHADTELVALNRSLGVSMSYTSLDQAGAQLVVEDDVLPVVPGGRIRVVAVGLAGGGSLDAWLASTPRELGTRFADGSGVIEATFEVPQNLGVGAHTLNLRFELRGGASALLTIAVDVRPATRSLWVNDFGI